MNDDMPWVDLTPEEIQQLRTKKHELTEYGKQKIRELMTHEEMLEEAAKREAIVAKVSDEDYQKVLDAARQGIEQYKPALEELAATERQELINEALEELNAIVLGGQNTREFYLSISHIRNVLERLK